MASPRLLSSPSRRRRCTSSALAPWARRSSGCWRARWLCSPRRWPVRARRRVARRRRRRAASPPHLHAFRARSPPTFVQTSRASTCGRRRSRRRARRACLASTPARRSRARRCVTGSSCARCRRRRPPASQLTRTHCLLPPSPIHPQLVGVVDGFALKAGDIVVELATRVDTVTMWAEVKSRGAHFLNTGAERGDARGRRRCCRCRRRARHTRLPRAPFLPQALTCGRTWSWT